MPTTQLKAATGARTGNGLELFRDLASPDSATQFKAAMTLRSQLQLSFETAHQTDPAKPSGTTTDELPDDAAYALKRLVRGLASSRDRARQGFTLALVELLTVLKQLASVTVDTVVDLVESFNVLSNSLKAQEEREMLFARIFCVHSIVQSGLLTSSNSTSQQFLRVAKVLLACNKAKSYLAQASYSVLIDAAIEVIKSGKENCVNLDLTSFIIEVIKERGMGVEGVWFVAALQIEMRKQKLDFDWKSIFKGTWEHPANILHPSHSARLGKILKDAASTSPKLHPIFPIIISQIFTLDVNAISLGDFWTQIVEEPFFNSATHNYKFVGFLIFEETLQKGLWAVEKGATIDLSVLFSKSFLRCLINSLGKGEDAVLFKIAKTTAKKISTISSSSSKLGLKVIFQLIGLNGHQRFDIVTRTKTVEGIVGNLDEPEINTFITYLINLIVSDSGHNNDAAKTISAVSSPNIRMWALDQLQSILRAPKVPKKENWIKRVLHFLCVHSLFSVVKPFDGFEVVDLNAQVREHCRARFFGALAEVNSISLAAVEKKDGDVATTLAAGVMENGEYWAYDLVQFILELDGTGIGEQQQKKKISSGSFVKPVNALEARSLEARNMAVQEISAFRSKVTSLSKAKTPNTALIAQYKSFELLFLHVLLQVYTEPVDAVNILNELKSCADLVFSDTTPPQPKSVSSALSTPTKLAAKKRKVQQEEEENQDSENDEEGEQPNPVDVIVDILLSFLAKPSSLFRGVVENVFRVFCPVLTPNGINLIFDVLRAKSGIAGAAELFQQEGEDGDDDEDDDVDIIDVSEANINGDEKIGTENDDDENGDEEDEWDDDEEEDDDEDDDNESEFEDAAEDVDALKARLTAALGKHAVVDDGREDNGNNSDDDGNESLGDDDMEAFDEKLAAIFRERKNLKVQKRDTKQQVLHFKLRAVDLLEIFIKKQPSNPLILSLITPSLHTILETSTLEDSRELHAKMTALVKTKLAHVKEHPCLESLQHGVALLKEIHNLAATKAPTASFVGLCSAMAVLVVKSIACYYPDAVSLADTGTGDAGMSPQKKKKRRDDGGEKESVGSPIVEIYLASVENYMTKKRTRLYPSLFIDFCNKFPALGLQLLPKFAELIATTDTVEKGFKIVQGFNIMALCLQRLPVKENARYKNELIKFQKLFALALVEATRVNEEKGMTIARIKEIVKPSVTIIKRLKTAFTATTATATITGSGDVVNQNNNSVFADTKETIEGNLGDAEKAALKTLINAL